MLTAEEIKKAGLITPLVEKVKCGLSYGLEPNGYTIRLSNEFWYPKEKQILDPLNKKGELEVVKTNIFILKPKHYVLGKAIEYINLPKNISAIALTKSSYARMGVFANITTIDAGWHGYLTIEIANLGNNPVKIYANYGIAEILFFEHKNTQGYEGNYQDLTTIKI